jgi:tRNA(fMet)-specific endonuclease VapC
MSGELLLDTNAVIAQMNGDPAFRAVVAAQLLNVPVPVFAEMFYGAEKSFRAAENLARVGQYAATALVLGTDLTTARIYGTIRQELQSKGRPIPINDIWIAAVARQYDLTLMTRDAHFNNVPGLRLVSS